MNISDSFGIQTSLKIIQEPMPPQKIALSNKVDISDGFRKEFDQWLAGMFGYKPSLLPDGAFYVNRDQGYAIGNAHTVSLLKIAKGI